VNQRNTLKNFRSAALSLAVATAIIAAGGVAFYGLPRVSVYVYRFASPVSGWVFILDLLLLPFAVSRKLRRTVGAVIFVSSYLFGLVLWFFSAIVAFSYWGYLGLFIGLIWLGIGVVPVALLAAALNKAWAIAGVIAADFVFVMGARILGAWLSDRN